MVVNYFDFLAELETEVNEMKTHGTSYRYETAKLALEVAKNISDFQLFSDLQRTSEVVCHQLPTETPTERIEDVSKSLNTISRSLYRDPSSSEVFQKELNERSKNRDKRIGLSQ